MNALRWLVQNGNWVGLLFDIAGAVVIFRFGLPPQVNRDGAINMAPGTRRVGTDYEAVRKARRYERLGQLGLGLLILGFVLQFIPSFAQQWK